MFVMHAAAWQLKKKCYASPQKLRSKNTQPNLYRFFSSSHQFK
jgi:hypothetical protein